MTINNLNHKQAIAILGGNLKKDATGQWRTTSFSEGDEHGALGDRLRVIAGSYLYNDDHKKIIITLGGRADVIDKLDVPIISQIIKTELIERGVASDSIITEDNSGSTYEQLKELKKIIKDLHLTQVEVISNKYHLPRIQAMIEANDELKTMLDSSLLKLIAAEEVLIEHEPKWEKEIQRAYDSQAMRERIALEQKGIGDIKEGRYKFK